MMNLNSMENRNNRFIYSLVCSPDFIEDGLAFAASSTGLFTSQDRGDSWQDAFESLLLQETIPASAVILSPEFTTDRIVFAGAPGCIFRSTDRGKTWSISYLPTPPPFISDMAISPNFARDGVIFACSLEDGVFISRNRGVTWTSSNFGLLDLNVYCLAISPDYAQEEILFCGAESGLYRSANGGRAWRETRFPIDMAPVISLAISPDFSTSGVLMAGTDENGLWISSDRGDSWDRVCEEQLDGAINLVRIGSDYPSGAVLALNGGSLLLSRDGGCQWRNWSESPDNSIVAATAPFGYEPGVKLLAGLDNGSIRWY
ncbi:MAG: hypothetical protein JXA42_03125 [Anaerolineales bacterium]|nr:hypothetical protein [Anaerolineales bacterium]